MMIGTPLEIDTNEHPVPTVYYGSTPDSFKANIILTDGTPWEVDVEGGSIKRCRVVLDTRV